MYDKLGNGTTQSSNTPIKVVDGGVIALTAGDNHSQIVKSDVLCGLLGGINTDSSAMVHSWIMPWTKVLNAGVRGVKASYTSVFVFADPNQAPTDLYLSNNTILENQPVGTMVGELHALIPTLGSIPKVFLCFRRRQRPQHNSFSPSMLMGVFKPPQF